MPQTLPRRVAVIGAGEIGCGWAALCASAGWPVTVFDASARGLERAATEVPRRARALVALERAAPGIVERGLQEFHQGRSLLQAVTDADWIIEAIPEDLVAKQRLFEMTEPLALPDALLTSSSSGLAPADIFARCRRQGQCLVAHPLNPPELDSCSLEVVPSPHTDPAAVRRADDYLHGLWPSDAVIPIQRSTSRGYVVGRIAAAVWRECVDLVLTGVIEVDALDRAVALGPALGWAAAGPCLTYHLAAGEGGVTGFLQRLLASFEEWWAGLASWQRLEPEQQRALVRAVERAYKGQVAPLSEVRDQRLSALLRALGVDGETGGSEAAG